MVAIKIERFVWDGAASVFLLLIFAAKFEEIFHDAADAEHILIDRVLHYGER